MALPVPGHARQRVQDARVARVAAPQAAIAGAGAARAPADGLQAAVAPGAHLADRVPALPEHPVRRMAAPRVLLPTGRAAAVRLRHAGADEAAQEVVVAAVEVAAVVGRPPPAVLLLVAAPSP